MTCERTAWIYPSHGRWIVADVDRQRVVATCPTRRAAYEAARAQGYQPDRLTTAH
jgi:hypothetical protein